MSQQQTDGRLTAEQAYQRLIHELYENGPFRLVAENGHPDLVNNKVRLCCVREPFLDVINAMQQHQLVQEITNEQHDRVYTLTYKGFLTALLVQCRSKRDSRCKCNKCADGLMRAFEHLLQELQRAGPMQLVVSEHRGHPHFVASQAQLCCSLGPFLDAMCELEHYGLVSMSADFIYRLTPKGAVSVQYLQLPDSATRGDRAIAN